MPIPSPAFKIIYHDRSKSGFTLAELLIALAILGVIATFTIPKVLQAQQDKRRLAVAQEMLGVLSPISRDIAMENRGCFPGNITCNFDPNTGAALDGLPTLSSPGSNPGPYNAIAAYLDTKLNYVYKTVNPGGSGLHYYYFSNSATIALGPVQVWTNPNNQKDLYFIFGIYLDRTPEQVIAGQYSQMGIDTHQALIYTFRNGRSYGGYNNFRRNFNLSYSAGFATIFDLEEHPQDTCVAVGGTNCGI